MSYADRIRSAPDLPSAIIILAEGIDAILAQSPAPTVDPWGATGWATKTVSAIDPERITIDVRDESREQTRLRAVEATREALATETDADNRTALEARLRLLEDDGEALDTEAPIGLAAVSEQIGDQIVTTLPTPSSERQTARMNFAHTNELWNFSVLDADEFTGAFMKGGPLWLYHTARDEVMAMPVEWRRWLVEEIGLDSPRTAQEVGRDILKDAEPSGNKSVTLEGINGDD